MKRIRFIAKGLVQGVGYRYFVRLTASRLNLSGWVANRPNGTVEGEAQGEPDAITKFVESIRHGCVGAVVKDLKIVEMPLMSTPDAEPFFEIRY